MSTIGPNEDSREELQKFLRPFHELHQVLKTPGAGKSGVEDASEHQNACLMSMYESLCNQSTEFKTKFPTMDPFAKMFSDCETSASDLLKKRHDFYNEDSVKLVDSLGSLLKQVPDVNPDSPEDYVAAVQKVESKLLDQCDSASEIIIAVEKDCVAFKCDPPAICSTFSEPRLNLNGRCFPNINQLISVATHIISYNDIGLWFMNDALYQPIA
jgi:hypothetical protein